MVAGNAIGTNCDRGRFMEDIFCIDCGKLMDQPMAGIVAGAWLRTDGDKSIVKAVPGGSVYGNELGFVCNECHDKNSKIAGVIG